MRLSSLVLAALLFVGQTVLWTDCRCGMTCPKPGECPACPGERPVKPEFASAGHGCCKHKGKSAPVREARHTPAKKCQHLQPQRDVLPPADTAALDPLTPLPAFLAVLPTPGDGTLLSEIAITESPPDTGPPLFIRVANLRL